jgi:hypothetical protein
MDEATAHDEAYVVAAAVVAFVVSRLSGVES